MNRSIKQVIVAVVFFLILGLLSYFGFQYFKPPLPSPSPSPTVALKSLEVLDEKLLPIRSGDYDFVARIRNPNAEHGSGGVFYALRVFNTEGNEITRQEGSFYILPNQIKHVVISPLTLDPSATSARLEILRIVWEKIDLSAVRDISLAIRDNSPFQFVNRPGLFGTVSGTIYNDSDVDLNVVDVNVILRDELQEVVAVSKTQINTFLAKTNRGFETNWFDSFLGQATDVEVEVGTNMFVDANFIRRFGTQEQFQEFY